MSAPAQRASAMSTENWIAVFFILLVPLIALILTLRHRLKETYLQQIKFKEAYQALDHEISERTQNLRALNTSLHGEIHKLEATEKRLHQSEEYLQSIIDSMPSILIGVRRDGSITHWNHSAEINTGLQEKNVLGRTLWTTAEHFPVTSSMIEKSIDDKTPEKKQRVKIIRDNEIHYLDIAIYPLLSTLGRPDVSEECIIQIDDVTVQAMMESRIIQNEKMLSLGELAAGMAHEINNPLGAILQNVQNIERRLSTNLSANKKSASQIGLSLEALEKYLGARQIDKLLGGIRDAGERSARIVSNMLEFSHRSERHTAININELIHHCLELAENQLTFQKNGSKKNIKVITEFTHQLPQLLCSPAEIQQVILNLLRNAGQSFRQADFSPQSEPCIWVATNVLDDQIRISIKDNGPGIPEHVIRHVFEPFFTTKESGHGTGLGLSISYFIITEHHQGDIQVKSTLGLGTTFTILLPL